MATHYNNGKFHEQRDLEDYNPQSHKESDMAEYETSKCIVVYLCCLDLHFPNDIRCLCMFFGDVSVKIFDIFLIAFVCLFSYCQVLRVLYQFWITNVSFANIFSPSAMAHSFSSTMCLAEQKVLLLMKSNLSIISLINHTFSVLC